MFGYVLPAREKLSEESWQDYRAVYCGLCHTLRERYGFWAQFLLNYDFTFLALLLRQEPQMPCVSCRRCLSSPIRGRQTSQSHAALLEAADVSVLLVYWKLRDQVADERGLRRLSALFLLSSLRGMFRRGRERAPALDGEIGSHLSELQRLEREGCPSIDRTADQFAQVLTATVPQTWEEPRRRSLVQLLYHLGRWIYLVDAWDDLDRDLVRGRYNPVAARFGLRPGASEEERQRARESMERTVRHSENLAISAFHLGDFGYSAPVVENVLCAGLPSVRYLVFSGEWKKRRKQKKQELRQR